MKDPDSCSVFTVIVHVCVCFHYWNNLVKLIKVFLFVFLLYANIFGE